MLKRAKWKSMLMDFVMIMAGSVCYAVSIGMFSAPNNIAPGGLTGIATLLNYMSTAWNWPFEIPIGVATIVMNVPLLIAAWTSLGRGMALRSMAGILISSVLVDGLQPYIPPYTNNPILVCIFGGVILGLGVGLILRRGGTTGGSEVISRLIEKKNPHMSVGSLIMVVDAIVITISAVVYGHLENALYAVVFVFLGSQVIDWVVYGGRKGKMLLILSQKQADITEAITKQADRGVTLLHSQGGYSGQEQKMILCTVRPDEVFLIRQLTYGIDPDAFVMVLTTDEVRGNRWLDPHE